MANSKGLGIAILAGLGVLIAARKAGAAPPAPEPPPPEPEPEPPPIVEPGHFDAQGRMLAFPGAEGWGANTPGGRGGKVYIVTNTNSTGPGSLYQGLIATGPRIIVFRVSGVINLQTNKYYPWKLLKQHSNVTVAGQTSPGQILQCRQVS